MDFLKMFALCDTSVAIESLKIMHFSGILAVSFAVGCVFVSILRRSLEWVPLYGVLFVFHPAWTMHVTSADCGLGTRFPSIAASLILAAILLCQILRANFSRRRLLIILCVISWLGYFSGIYLVEYWGVPRGLGFITEAIASLRDARVVLSYCAIVLSFICLLQWLWYRFLSQTAMNSVRDRSGYKSKMGVRLLCIALSCFFLGYTFVAWNGVNGQGVSRPDQWTMALAVGIVLLLAAIRGRFPGWDLPQSNESITAK
jgi:hypothetical protein